jgi:hypothetical protein
VLASTSLATVLNGILFLQIVLYGEGRAVGKKIE